jgi:hypothetical protein
MRSGQLDNTISQRRREEPIMDLIKNILVAPFKAVVFFFEAIEDARSLQNEYAKKTGRFN